MIVERIGNSTVIKAEGNKCLIRKGEEQKIEDNNTTIIYIDKSFTKDQFVVININFNKNIIYFKNKKNNTISVNV